MKSKQEEYDVVLIGAGIMSATLGTLIKKIQPNWTIRIVERLESSSMESSNSLSNAGTGHSGFCELNYDLEKAIETCEAFEKSKQFWSYLVKNGDIEQNFIHQVPHISFVHGEKNVEALYKRYLEMKKICLFADMEFSDDFVEIQRWCPLIVEGRNSNEPIAATRMIRGTDIDFWKLTTGLIEFLKTKNVSINYNTEVTDLKQNEDKSWNVFLKNIPTKEKETIKAKFVFIGAGGASLTLLQKSGIPEVKGYGGFPVSGQWLICDNPQVVWRHQAKVYGKPEIGSPPMSTPHLDTRIIHDKKLLLFGPYAEFSTKFLKFGHWTDFFKSLRFSNIFVILSAGLRNLGLSKYLLSEVSKSHKTRFKTLLSYYPTANINDWKPLIAGQRVQVIKKDNGIPTIEFGTEIVTSKDCSIAALLGASPGASTSVNIMLEVIEKCFKQRNYREYDYWMSLLRYMIPSSKDSLHEDEHLFKDVEKTTSEILFLNKEIVSLNNKM